MMIFDLKDKKMTALKKFTFVFISIFFIQVSLAASIQDFNTDAQTLLSRLDLTQPGLEQVKSAIDNPSLAIKELLEYYRSGNPSKHPIDKNLKSQSLGNYAGQQDITVANNAVKHIFIGQPSYPSYFRGEDIDWKTNPVADNEWIWQMHRMVFWDALGRAYWHTGDEKYAQAWTDQLVDWVRKNPNDRAHDYAWRTIEAGIRGNSWTGLFQRFIDSPSFTPEVLVTFLNSCYDHASYLMTRYTRGGNWALMEAEGIAFIAISFPEFSDAGKWRAEAFRRFNEEIIKQVYPDGHQRELAFGYHMGCINWFLRPYELAKMNGIENQFSSTYLEIIEKMCEVPMKISLPNGTHAQFGDDWEGGPEQNRGQFLKWAELFNREDFMYLATNGEKGKVPGETAYALPQSGIYSMRSGWNKEAICLVLKCGPDGGFHCQPDNGTFDLYAGGRNLMPDAGCYIYHGDPENREWFRQTKVHQTLTLDNADSKYAPRLKLWSTDENLNTLVVENDSYENLTHRRSIFFVDKKYFIIMDEAFGTATGQIGLHFQLAPGEAVFDEKNRTVNSAFDKGWNVSVRCKPQKGMELIKEEGQVSFKYTEKEPRPAFCYRLNKKTGNGVRFITVVVPYGQGDIPHVDVDFPMKTQVGSSSVQFKIKNEGKTQTLGYSL
jgi:heparan-sulfate lyase